MKSLVSFPFKPLVLSRYAFNEVTGRRDVSLGERKRTLLLVFPNLIVLLILMQILLQESSMSNCDKPADRDSCVFAKQNTVLRISILRGNVDSFSPAFTNLQLYTYHVAE